MYVSPFLSSFLSTLLKDALGLLHEDMVSSSSDFFQANSYTGVPLQLVFSSEQTYVLSDYVLKLTMAPTFAPTEDSQRAEVVMAVEKELVSLLRLALVKNLSRALMEECG